MPHHRVDAPARAFAVLAEFDNLDGDIAQFVRLVREGHVFHAWDVTVGGSSERVAERSQPLLLPKR